MRALWGALALLLVLSHYPAAADGFKIEIRSRNCELTPELRSKLTYLSEDMQELLEAHRRRAETCLYGKLASGTLGLLVLEPTPSLLVSYEFAEDAGWKLGYTLRRRQVPLQEGRGEWIEGKPPSLTPLRLPYIGLLQGASHDSGRLAVMFLVWWRTDRKMVDDADIQKFLAEMLEPPAP